MIQPAKSPNELNYWCFISYRHADNKHQDRDWASWLHREIERYEVPAELVGTTNKWDELIPDRIYPVFRDEDSLPADSRLRDVVSRALHNSRVLVVLCSPKAAESKYVEDEIQYFIDLGREEKIIPVILYGRTSEETQDCFPSPLIANSFETLDSGLGNSGPLAADFRLPDGGEGYISAEAYRRELLLSEIPKRKAKMLADAYEDRLQLMKLKIFAGILGISLDSLSKRDKAHQLLLAKKRYRTLIAWLLLVCALTVFASIAALYALEARNEEFAQRKKAEEKEKEAQIATKLAESEQSTTLYHLAANLLKSNDPGNARLHLKQAAKFSHNDPSISIAVEIAGRLSSELSADNTVHLPETVIAAQLTPDVKRCVATLANGNVIQIEFSSGKVTLLSSMEIRSDDSYAGIQLRITPDSRFALCMLPKLVKIIDLQSGVAQDFPPPSGGTYRAINLDGSSVFGFSSFEIFSLIRQNVDSDSRYKFINKSSKLFIQDLYEASSGTESDGYFDFDFVGIYPPDLESSNPDLENLPHPISVRYSSDGRSLVFDHNAYRWMLCYTVDPYTLDVSSSKYYASGWVTPQGADCFDETIGIHGNQQRDRDGSIAMFWKSPPNRRNYPLEPSPVNVFRHTNRRYPPRIIRGSETFDVYMATHDHASNKIDIWKNFHSHLSVFSREFGELSISGCDDYGTNAFHHTLTAKGGHYIYSISPNAFGDPKISQSFIQDFELKDVIQREGEYHYLLADSNKINTHRTVLDASIEPHEYMKGNLFSRRGRFKQLDAEYVESLREGELGQAVIFENEELSEFILDLTSENVRATKIPIADSNNIFSKPNLTAVVQSSGGRFLLGVFSRNGIGMISVVDMLNGEDLFECGNQITSFSSSGYFIGHSAELKLFDRRGRQIYSNNERVLFYDFLPSRNILALKGAESELMTVFDANQKEVVADIPDATGMRQGRVSLHPSAPILTWMSGEYRTSFFRCRIFDYQKNAELLPPFESDAWNEWISFISTELH